LENLEVGWGVGQSMTWGEVDSAARGGAVNPENVKLMPGAG